MACNDQSPRYDKDKIIRTRCNRLAGHDGPHRRIRAKDFAVTAEWAGDRYTILPGGIALDDAS